MNTSSSRSYRRRVDKAIRYIRQNPQGDLSLETIADIAHFSTFHFHRIFKALTGESLGLYVQRTRLHSAAMALRSNRSLSISDAAYDHGYDSPDGFRRAFRRWFGINPSQWDRSTPLQERKIGRTEHEFPVYSYETLCGMAQQRGWSAEVVRLPAITVGSLTVMDAYRDFNAVMAAYDRLWHWYEGEVAGRSDAMFLGCSQDDPDLTPLEQCAFEWAAGPVDPAEAPDWLSCRRQPEQSVVRIRLQGDIQEEDEIWQYLYRVWLPDSAYEPAHATAMEVYCQPPHKTDWKTYDLWCALPLSDISGKGRVE